jgi:hypothetical protein
VLSVCWSARTTQRLTFPITKSWGFRQPSEVDQFPID